MSFNHRDYVTGLKPPVPLFFGYESEEQMRRNVKGQLLESTISKAVQTGNTIRAELADMTISWTKY